MRMSFFALLAMAMLSPLAWAQGIDQAVYVDADEQASDVRLVSLSSRFSQDAGAPQCVGCENGAGYGAGYGGGGAYGGDYGQGCADGSCYGGCGSGCGGCDSCCNNCDSGCGGCLNCCQGKAGNWVGGANVYILKPFWDNNSPVAVLNNNGAAVRNEEFQWNYTASPGGWVGYSGCNGFGFRGRYFEFEHGSRAMLIPATPGQFLTYRTPVGQRFDDAAAFVSNLRLNTWDLEATQAATFCDWDLTFAGGIRYVNTVQGLAGASINNFLFANDFPGAVGILFTRTTFSGAGPTVALNLRRGIGCRGLGFYTDTRLSAAFGDRTQRSIFLTNGGAPQTLIRSHWSNVTIAEIETGFDFQRDFGSRMGWVKVGAVGQLWTGMGNASQNDPITGAVNHGNMGLFGIKGEMGVAW